MALSFFNYFLGEFKMLYSLITLFLTAIIYLIPLLIWLPFKLSRLQKICLYLIIFCNLCLISFFTGNIGVLLLLFTTGTYLALINPQRIQNIVLLILDYLFNVLWDNILTTLIWYSGILMLLRFKKIIIIF